MAEPTKAENAAAYEAMMALVAEHHLSFTHNPGGGEFAKRGDATWRCQVANYGDNVADLAKLNAALGL